MDKYPADTLGISARKKVNTDKDSDKNSDKSNYLKTSMASLRKKLEASLDEVEERLSQLYPER